MSHILVELDKFQEISEDCKKVGLHLLAERIYLAREDLKFYFDGFDSLEKATFNSSAETRLSKLVKIMDIIDDGRANDLEPDDFIIISAILDLVIYAVRRDNS